MVIVRKEEQKNIQGVTFRGNAIMLSPTPAGVPRGGIRNKKEIQKGRQDSIVKLHLSREPTAGKSHNLSCCQVNQKKQLSAGEAGGKETKRNILLGHQKQRGPTERNRTPRHSGKGQRHDTFKQKG